MSWTAWILSSAVFLAFYDLAKKASVRDNAVLPTLLVSTCCGSALYLAGLAIGGRFVSDLGITSEVVCLSATKCIIVGISWVFTFCALRTLPISIATPIRASAPALVFLIAIALYGERPSPLQSLGMVSVFGGYFVFSWAGRHEGLDFFRSKAVWYAVAGAFFAAISAIWDKYVFQVRGLPVEGVQFVFQVGLVAFYALAMAVERLVRPQGSAFEWRWSIPLVGILLVTADWLYFHGLACPGTPISLASLLRRFSVVVTFILGARIFRETNLVRKGLALSAIVAGVVLICLS